MAEKEESLLIPEPQTVRKTEQGTTSSYQVGPENEANTQEAERGKKRDTHIKPWWLFERLDPAEPEAIYSWIFATYDKNFLS